MARYVPVRRSTHGGFFWRGARSLDHAARDRLLPAALGELERLALQMPLAFARHGGDGDPTCVAITGLREKRNLFVSAAGKWRLPYLPAHYRGYPFRLREAPDGTVVLMIDADCGLTNSDEGKPFYEEDGEPASQLQEVVRFLRTLAADREATARASAALREAGVLVPWELSTAESDAALPEGLQRVDAVALRQLQAEALEALHALDALRLAHYQLLSMHHLETLLRVHREARSAFDPERDSIEELFGGGDEVLSFGFD